MIPATKIKATPEEYLAMDRDAERKSEYHDGEMFPVVSATKAHSKLCVNLSGILWQSTQDSGSCEVLSFMRVRVLPTKYVYADLAMVCGEAQTTDEGQETLVNPAVIFEILSPSTADYDQGGKFNLCKKLDSFREYVLLSQEEVSVEVRREKDAGFWTMETFSGLDELLRSNSSRAVLSRLS